jgi:hypothetical protein
MPHQVLKVQPGVNTNETPVLNMAGVSECDKIRFRQDPAGLGLVEKLGGWTRFYTGVFDYAVRHLFVWQEIDTDKFVAVGMADTGGVTLLRGTEELNAVTGQPTGFWTSTPSGALPLTPLFRNTDAGTATLSTTAGSPFVTINDPSLDTIHTTDSVYFATHVAIGGLVLFGQYAVYSTLSFTSYTIVARTVLGAPQAASTASTAPALPVFTTVTDSYEITVTLPKHGYVAGDVFPLLIATTVANVTLAPREYEIQRVPSLDTFVILGNVIATAGASAQPNGNKIRLVYNIGGAPSNILSGYGAGPYGGTAGDGGYGRNSGAAPSAPGTPASATDWSFDNWGSILLASPRGAIVDGILVSGIYQWEDETGAKVLSLIAEAPPCNDGFFVAMPQRQIVAWGSSFTGIQDPLLVRWCDVNDYSMWAATITNQAGSYRIPKGSKIVGALQAAQQGLLWTDIGVWTMQYISQPYIYSFNELGTGCGLLAQKGAASVNGVVYWISHRQFFMLSGGGVQPIPCPVWDIVFQSIDRRYYDKIRVAPNAMFNEIAWFFTSVNSADHENDSYVKFNYVLNAWDYGTIRRSAWVNQSVLGPPMGAGVSPEDGQIRLFQHERTPDADGQPMHSWFATGYFAMAEGDSKIFVDEIWPDMKWGAYGVTKNATVDLTFTAKDFPSQDPQMTNTFSFTVGSTYVTPRLRGRLMQVTLGSNDRGSFWRLGGMRYRAAPDGKY